MEGCVRGVEVCGRGKVCGGKGGGVWEGWSSGRNGGVWWEGWRCVRGVEVCGRGGGVWEGWRCVGVVDCGGRDKVCGGKGGGECGRGGMDGASEQGGQSR